MSDIDDQIKKLADLHVKQLEWMAHMVAQTTHGICPECEKGIVERNIGTIQCYSCHWPIQEIRAAKELAGS